MVIFLPTIAFHGTRVDGRFVVAPALRKQITKLIAGEVRVDTESATFRTVKSESLFVLPSDSCFSRTGLCLSCFVSYLCELLTPSACVKLTCNQIHIHHAPKPTSLHRVCEYGHPLTHLHLDLGLAYSPHQHHELCTTQEARQATGSY